VEAQGGGGVTISFCLGIPHTPWVEARAASFARLVEGLELVEEGLSLVGPCPDVETVRVFGEKAANHEWSAAMWKWGAEQVEASHFVTLQNDAVPMPGFWAALRAMVEARPNDVIGLEVASPFAPAIAAEGHAWFTTSDALVGVGYVLPRALLAEFLEWRASSLKPGWDTVGSNGLPAITEDTMLGLFCLVTGRRIYHPVPTIIDHDVSIASTYGNDEHANRRPLVRWDRWDDPKVLEDDSFWREADGEIPHVGRHYDATPALAYQWVKGFDASAFTRARCDDGTRVKRAIGLRLRARRADEPRPRLLVATPTRGNPAMAYTSTLLRLLAAAEFDAVDGFELLSAWLWTEDVVRVRSRYVRAFLETDCTHLLFLDDDVSSDEPARLVAGMLAADRDVVCAPYPKRDGVDFARVKQVWKTHDIPAEAAAYRYAMHLLGGVAKLEVEADQCAEVEGIGLGCSLIKRGALESMVERYREELGFDDVVNGQAAPTVALFQLILRARALLSEDYSFCTRWRAMGGKVHMYLGPGAPVHHHGAHVYRGSLEAFGLRRAER
jgi:hypothetical protein